MRPAARLVCTRVEQQYDLAHRGARLGERRGAGGLQRALAERDGRGVLRADEGRRGAPPRRVDQVRHGLGLPTADRRHSRLREHVRGRSVEEDDGGQVVAAQVEGGERERGAVASSEPQAAAAVVERCRLE